MSAVTVFVASEENQLFQIVVVSNSGIVDYVLVISFLGVFLALMRVEGSVIEVQPLELLYAIYNKQDLDALRMDSGSFVKEPLDVVIAHENWVKHGIAVDINAANYKKVVAEKPSVGVYKLKDSRITLGEKDEKIQLLLEETQQQVIPI